MDWLYIVMPIAGVPIFWPGLVILGLGVGIIGGFFGMGGGWMVTPGLNILGFPMAFAIGTDITQMGGMSLISSMRHSRFGNIDYRLGVIMVVGTVAGFETGAQIIMWLERIGHVDLFVRLGYLVLLSLIAWLVFTDVSQMKKDLKIRKAAEGGAAEARGIQWHRTFQRLPLPPVVHFKTAGIRCSVWLPIAVSYFTGFLAGILGIGGGLIRMPALIYLVGAPTHVAVGTDLFEVAISSLYGAASYTYKGRTELVAAVIMMVGAAIGAQIGSITTKYVQGYGIRLFFGIAVVGCAVSIAMKLAAAAFLPLRFVFDLGAAILILGLVGVLASIIFARFVRGVQLELRAQRATEPAAPAPESPDSQAAPETPQEKSRPSR
jgi:uncharacterized membrane protein YfcA